MGPRLHRRERPVRGRGRQLEGDRAAGWRLDPDPTAVGFDQATGDRQAEAGAAAGAVATLVGTAEAVEGERGELGVEAGALVRHPDGRRPGVVDGDDDR